MRIVARARDRPDIHDVLEAVAHAPSRERFLAIDSYDRWSEQQADTARCVGSWHPPPSVEPLQQQMKVNQPCVRPPLAQHPVDMVIVRRSFQPQPSMETLLCPDIIAGKLVNPSEAAQQRVFSGPTSDS